MADYPSKKLVEQHIPKTRGHVGVVIDSNIEGRGPEAKTVRAEGRGNKKGAGHIGASNVNHA